MSKNLQVQLLNRSLPILIAICCLVSISADRLIVGVDGKKDKDKGKGGHMVIMMGGGGYGGGGGGGKGGGYGGGGGGGYGRGGGGGGFPIPIPMPMPMYCPPNFGGRKSAGRGGGVKEKIVIIPIPAQMLAGGEKGTSYGEVADEGGETYGRVNHESSGGGYGSQAPISSGFGGGGGSYHSVAEMPAMMMHGSGDYGSTFSRDFGGGARGGDNGGYGSASHAYSIEMAPINGIMNSGSGVDSIDYPLDQYASGSSHRAAISGPSDGGYQTTESSYSRRDQLAVSSAEQFDLQTAASGENNPPPLKNTVPSISNSETSFKAKSVSSGEKQKPHRRRK